LESSNRGRVHPDLVCILGVDYDVVLRPQRSRAGVGRQSNRRRDSRWAFRPIRPRSLGRLGDELEVERQSDEGQGRNGYDHTTVQSKGGQGLRVNTPLIPVRPKGLESFSTKMRSGRPSRLSQYGRASNESLSRNNAPPKPKPGLGLA